MKPHLRSTLNTGLMSLALAGSLSIVVLRAGGAEAAPSSWSVTPSPNHGGGTNSLNGISCTSSTSCMAVGYAYNKSGAAKTLVESWNGTSWLVVPSPNQGTDDSYLYGVHCTDPSNCVAVGDDITPGASGAELTLVESWNGTAWSIVPSPNLSTSINSLSSVYCTSSTSCMAVGDAVTGSGESEAGRSLVESWNGTMWSVIPSSDTGKGDTLDSVYCTRSTSCMAVGDYVNGDTDVRETMAEYWDGAAWSLTLPSSSSPFDNILNGVYCSSSTSCVAVGAYDKLKEQLAVPKTLVESWNGSNWAVVHSPTEGYATGLNGISCTKAQNCVGVGFYAISESAPFQTLVESWNGSTWSVTPSPNQNLNANNLNTVSCTTSSTCDAVGDYANGSDVNKTLVENGS
jgi:hypothetical protein